MTARHINYENRAPAEAAEERTSHWKPRASDTLFRALRVSRALSGGPHYFKATISDWEARNMVIPEHDILNRPIDLIGEMASFLQALRQSFGSERLLRGRLAEAYVKGDPIDPWDLAGEDRVVAEGFYLDLESGDDDPTPDTALTTALQFHMYKERAREIAEQCRPRRGRPRNQFRVFVHDFVIVLIRVGRQAGYELTAGGNDEGQASPFAFELLRTLQTLKMKIIDLKSALGLTTEKANELAAELGEVARETRQFKEDLRNLIKDFG